MANVTLTHPRLPGRTITVSEASAAVHQKAGWVPAAGEADDTAKPRTVKQIKAEVGDDPAKAAAELVSERNGAQRRGLIAHLEAVAATYVRPGESISHDFTTPNTDSPDQGNEQES